MLPEQHDPLSVGVKGLAKSLMRVGMITSMAAAGMAAAGPTTSRAPAAIRPVRRRCMRSGCELGEAYGQATARVIPPQRFGTPEEVGHAEAFFASLQASYITGQTLVIDGGAGVAGITALL